MADTLTEESKSLLNAEAKVNDLGLPRPGKPQEVDKDEEKVDVQWPSNVADLSPYDLAQHMTWWSGWSAHVRYHLGRAETNVENFEEAYNFELDESLYKSKGEYATVTAAKASIRQRPDMFKQKQKIQRAKAMVTILKSLLKGYEEKYATISREISRRGIDYTESVSSEGKNHWRART